MRATKLAPPTRLLALQFALSLLAVPYSRCCCCSRSTDRIPTEPPDESSWAELRSDETRRDEARWDAMRSESNPRHESESSFPVNQRELARRRRARCNEQAAACPLLSNNKHTRKGSDCHCACERNPTVSETERRAVTPTLGSVRLLSRSRWIRGLCSRPRSNSFLDSQSRVARLRWRARGVAATHAARGPISHWWSGRGQRHLGAREPTHAHYRQFA